MKLSNYLSDTVMLDFHSPCIQQLVNRKGWQQLSEKEKISNIYDFVRNEIKFGYNSSDDIPASQVLRDGYGQCNTKSTLLMALLRAVNIPCRIQGFYIDKKMQKGALTGITYLVAPKNIVHAWTEVYFEGEWVALEGVIIDDDYLHQVKDLLCQSNGGYIGYGIAVEQKERMDVCWRGQSTYIQSFSITDELGVYNSPDEFFKKYNNTNGFMKRILFNILRKKINKRLEWIRKV
ncbi:transglutaminase family protein [Lysinibacillus sp. NPDC096418]|uniref:transglutaminase-like domain-containing protein n=1 Tax=Lysinibacillus sp. NPDC096418 TaxID=3364138 RepID=UPI003814784C